MQKTLDLSIKKAETGTLDGGYSVTDCKPYSSYMSNREWDAFVDDMQTNHRAAYIEYGAGSGGEMKPNGKYPPKMASYGSSSRMIYNLCRGNPNFHFEKKLPTKVGGTANLDGYMETEDTCYFVEAKCREPYGGKPHLIESKYKRLYEHISGDPSVNLHIETKDTDGKMSVAFSVENIIISRFDIKQMICHLLGIACQFLSQPTDKKISFIYLCYNPKLISIIDKDKEPLIYEAYDGMCAECQAIDFKNLFASIIRYLHFDLHIGHATEDEVSTAVNNFVFSLCDQDNCPTVLKLPPQKN